MTMHKLHLHNEPFELVQSGLKTMEARLYDERRQRIEIGDEIIFTNRTNNKTIAVTVHKIHRAPTFHDLYVQHGPEVFGDRSIDEAEKTIAKYYSYSDQLQNGVMAIAFVLKK